MDRFTEQVVVKHNRTLDDIAYYLSLVVMIFFAIFAFFLLNAVISYLGAGVSFSELLPNLILAIVFGGIAVLLYLNRGKLKTEYEYTFTNGDLDFAAVYNNVKRKPLGTLNVRNVDVFGKVNSPQFQRYLNMKDIKQMRWFLNRGAELYYFYFQKNGNKRLLIFEPNEELVEYIRQYLPQGAYQKD